MQVTTIKNAHGRGAHIAAGITDALRACGDQVLHVVGDATVAGLTEMVRRNGVKFIVVDATECEANYAMMLAHELFMCGHSEVHAFIAVPSMQNE